MRFLIVAPQFVNKVGQYYNFPLGLAYISSSLKKNGFHVKCLNLNHYGERIETVIEREIRNNDIEVVCTGGLAVHYKKVRAILDAARKIKEDIVTIIGGGLLSSDPVLMMNTLKTDFGIIGEGEKTIVEIADALVNSRDFSEVKGLVYYDAYNNLITNPKRPPINDIGSIAYPDYEGFEFNKFINTQMPNDEHYLYLFDKPRAIPMILSRSCPYSCTFCYHPLGKKYRQRPLDDFFRELDCLLEKYNVNIILVLDELFSTDKKRISEFCSRMKKYNLKWTIPLRVDRIDNQTLSILKEAGCFFISYGLESASEDILKSMKKNITLSQIENTLKLTYDNKIAIQGNFIFGDKEETLETANDTLRWWLNHREYQINLTRVCAYPGTELYNDAVGKKLINDRIEFLENGCPPVNSTKMGDDEYEGLIGLLAVYNRKYPMPAIVISCIQEGTDIYKGDVYSLEVKCPHCLKTVKYKNLHQNCNRMFKLGCRLRCRECNQQLNILPFKFYEKISGLASDCFRDAVNTLRNYRRVAVYGTGDMGKYIYESCLKNSKEVLYFIDDYKKGKYCNLDIISHEDVDKYPIPDLTIFANASTTFQNMFIFPISNNILWDTELHSETETFLYTPLGEGANSDDHEIIKIHYFAYYLNYWVPLLKHYFANDQNLSEVPSALQALP